MITAVFLIAIFMCHRIFFFFSYLNSYCVEEDKKSVTDVYRCVYMKNGYQGNSYLGNDRLHLDDNSNGVGVWCAQYHCHRHRRRHHSS